MTDRELMQMALDALETHGTSYLNHENSYEAAIKAMRDRLAQPEREWAGLTDEEKEGLVEAFYGTDIQRLEAIEAKLKEKNT